MLLEELAQECVGNIGGVLPSGKRHGMIPSLVGFNFSGIFFSNIGSSCSMAQHFS